jgi:hypothetical protein
MKKLWRKIVDWWTMRRRFEKMEHDIHEAEAIRFKRYELEAMMITDSTRIKKMNVTLELYRDDNRYFVDDRDVTGFMTFGDKALITPDKDGIEIEAECEVDYQPAERQTYDYPGYNATLTITGVTFDKDLSECFETYLSNYVCENYTESLLETYEENKYERDYDDEE